MAHAHLPGNHARLTLALDRTTLHSLLLAGIPGPRVHTSAEAVGVDARSGTVTFADGTEARFDIVVGADGIRSAVRASCFDDPGMTYAGYNTWRAITEGVPLDAGFETWGARTRFGAVPLHDGHTSWFAVTSGPEAQPGAQALHQLHATFGQWHDPIPALLLASPEHSVQYLPIHELAKPLASYYNTKVVLIGDAAHAMTANLGQGACQGLEDAAVLARLLRAGSTDFSAYDTHRRRRSQQVARQSRLIGRALHTGGDRVTAARNWILKHMPDAEINRQVQAVTAWEVPELGVCGKKGTSTSEKAPLSRGLPVVPGAGLEPARPYRTLAPEASASANSATRAGDLINITPRPNVPPNRQFTPHFRVLN